MRYPIPFAALSLVTAFIAMSVHAAVIVSFVAPDRFTDVWDFNSDSTQTMREVAQHLERLGDRYLSPEDKLTIEVLNIDLAGTSAFGGRINWPVRVMTGNADWPRIEVRYVLESDGKVSNPREETIVDRNYLGHTDPKFSSDPQFYEKRMLDEWFKQRFGERKR